MIVGILAENSIFTVWQDKTNRRNGGTVDESVDYAIALRIRPKLMTAIFAKVGVKEINSDLATAIRTTVILFVTWGIVLFGSHMGDEGHPAPFVAVPRVERRGYGLVVVILFQSIANG